MPAKNKPQHTPGPWEITESQWGEAGEYDLEIMRKDGDTIATIHQIGPCEIANARLIAAAPDLLEAAKRVATICAPDETGGLATKTMLEDAARMLRAVIAKAQGE